MPQKHALEALVSLRLKRHDWLPLPRPLSDRRTQENRLDFRKEMDPYKTTVEKNEQMGLSMYVPKNYHSFIRGY